MNLLYEKSRVKTESGNQRVHSEGGGGPVQRTGGAQPPYKNTKHSWNIIIIDIKYLLLEG